MNAQAINSTFDLVDLAGTHTTLKRTGRYWFGPCPFCGGKDRFEIKQGEGGQVWRCRHCAAEGYSSPIDYYMRYSGLDFRAALAAMGGNVCLPTVSIAKSEIKRVELPHLPDSTWQIKMLARVEAAAACLASPAGKPGQDYLTGRGFHLGIWRDFSLGYCQAINDPKLTVFYKVTRPAILIPWLDIREKLTCVNYRFVDDRPEGLRYKTVGMHGIFGLNCLAHHSTLIIVEGEFNCMSLRQAAAGSLGALGLDVVSIGAQTPSELTLALLKALVQRYERFLCWLDDSYKAQAFIEALGVHAKVICSPVIEGVKYDANELLKTGQLCDFIKLNGL